MSTNATGSCCSRATLNWIAVLGAFLLMVALVATLRYYTHPPPINQLRAAERLKILSDNHQKSQQELETAAYIDKEKGVVRLPNEVATALAVQLWQHPGAARSNLLERASKAFFVPPPPPEPKSEYE